MTIDSATRNLAVMARMRLDRLARPHEVRAYRVDEELLVCAACGFTLEHGDHSAAEIRWMADLVAAHDEARQTIASEAELAEMFGW